MPDFGPKLTANSPQELGTWQLFVANQVLRPLLPFCVTASSLLELRRSVEPFLPNKPCEDLFLCRSVLIVAYKMSACVSYACTDPHVAPACSLDPY